MARDVYEVTIQVRGPEYDCDTLEKWEEHYHKNKKTKQIAQAVNNGLSRHFSDIERSTSHEAVVDHVRVIDVELTKPEQQNYDTLREAARVIEETRYDRVDKVGEEIGIKLSTWSCSELDQGLFDNRVLTEGKVRFDDSHYGILGETLEDPTVRDLWLAADRAVKQRGGDHSFLEGISVAKLEDNVAVYEMHFGS